MSTTEEHLAQREVLIQQMITNTLGPEFGRGALEDTVAKMLRFIMELRTKLDGEAPEVLGHILPCARCQGNYHTCVKPEKAS